MEVKGIDISHWQGIVDFSKLRSSGVNFAILKAGGSDAAKPYKDKKFDSYYKEAKANNIPVGCYYFVGKDCITFEKGVEYAEHFLTLIKGKKFEYPVYLDLEAPDKKYKSGITDACLGFCAVMESIGYYVGIYGSDVSGFKERMDLSRLTRYDIWVARYGVNPRVVKSYGMWQYSSKGKVNGIIGNVDLDFAYKNYPAIMIKNHLNGF